MKFYDSSGYRCGRTYANLQLALMLQKHSSVTVFVRDRRALDYVVAAGIKPSNIVTREEVKQIGDSGKAKADKNS